MAGAQIGNQLAQAPAGSQPPSIQNTLGGQFGAGNPILSTPIAYGPPPTQWGISSPSAGQAGSTVSTPAPTNVAPISGTTTTNVAPGAPNVFQQAAGGINQAMGATAANMYNPLMTAPIGAYQNPYTSQVIGATAMDLERQRQMQQNAIGAAATRAGAFGGSREAIERAATNEAFMRNLGQTAAGLRQQGFTQAQAAAQTDIQNRINAANQLANISNLGFGMGQTVQENLAQQGALQQALQQQLFDAAAAQYGGYTGAGYQGLQALGSALSSSPIPQSQKTSSSPGLLDIATAGAGIYGAIAF